jgi:HSP20 family protein
MNALNLFEHGKWNPFKEMELLQNRLGRSLLETSAMRAHEEESVGSARWAPLVDVVEDDKEYLLKVEIPEIRKDDVSVRVEKGVLRIEGERPFEKENGDKRVHRLERSYGHFTRTFSLPEDADAGQVKAAFKDGVLFVHVHKCEEAKPKQIEVTVD